MIVFCGLSAKDFDKSNAFSVAYSYYSVLKIYVVNCLDSVLSFLVQKLGKLD